MSPPGRWVAELRHGVPWEAFKGLSTLQKAKAHLRSKRKRLFSLPQSKTYL